ncbi:MULTISPECIES: TadE/TadG family type IV pilus assembly protein [Enorma]|uniref:Pilus assembly protein TadE n=1 Tax=[Collinsella] massiliensis TaxID=1232426 RepID=A0A1Y3XRN4_9ACTN|nr:hypothetical protein [Enorma timonensis]OUN86978.1 hypothetical protein B5G02_07950 [[Collinsella] massiliensis]
MAGEGSGRWSRRARALGSRLLEERAQATVEMAVVVPVLIVLALITYNVMVFLAASARFDRVAPDIVLAHAVAPSGFGDAASAVSDDVAGALADAMGSYDVDIEVTCLEDGDGGGSVFSLVGGQRTYRCVMRFEPWPSRLSIAGVDMGAPVALEHVREVVVDPWRPGVVM